MKGRCHRLCRRIHLHSVSHGKSREKPHCGKDHSKASSKLTAHAVFHIKHGTTQKFAVFYFPVAKSKHNFRIFEYHGKKSGYPHPEKRTCAAHGKRHRNACDIPHPKRSCEGERKLKKRRMLCSFLTGKHGTNRENRAA